MRTRECVGSNVATNFVLVGDLELLKPGKFHVIDYHGSKRANERFV